MVRHPPRSTRTDTLVPYASLFRSSIGFVGKPGGFDKVLELLAHHPGKACLAAVLEFVLPRFEIAIAELAGEAPDRDFADPYLLGERHRGLKGERCIVAEDRKSTRLNPSH